MYRSVLILLFCHVVLTSTTSGSTTAAVTCTGDGSGSSIAAGYGDVYFPTSSQSKDAQAHFTSGVALLHLFEYQRAREEFLVAQALHPDATPFGMALWGEAMTYFEIYGDDDIQAGRAVVGKFPINAGSDRENQYLSAVRALFSAGSRADRVALYSTRTLALVQAFPYDLEAHAQLALAHLFQATVYMGSSTVAWSEVLADIHGPASQGYHHVGLLHYQVLARVLAHQNLTMAQDDAQKLINTVAPSSSHAWLAAARVARAQGDMNNASRLAERAWELSLTQQRQFNFPSNQRNWPALLFLHDIDMQRGRFIHAKELRKAWSQYVPYNIDPIFSYWTRLAEGAAILTALDLATIPLDPAALSTPPPPPSSPSPAPAQPSPPQVSPIPANATSSSRQRVRVLQDESPVATSTSTLSPETPSSVLAAGEPDGTRALYVLAQSSRLLARGLELVQARAAITEVHTVRGVLDALYTAHFTTHPVLAKAARVSSNTLSSAASLLQGGERSKLQDDAVAAASLAVEQPTSLTPTEVYTVACRWAGYVLASSNQRQRALEILDRCLQRHPGQSGLHLARGRLRAAMGRGGAEVTQDYTAFAVAHEEADVGVDGVEEARGRVGGGGGNDGASTTTRWVLISLGIVCGVSILIGASVWLYRRQQASSQHSTGRNFGMVDRAHWRSQYTGQDQQQPQPQSAHGLRNEYSPSAGASSGINGQTGTYLRREPNNPGVIPRGARGQQMMNQPSFYDPARARRSPQLPPPRF